GLVSVLAALEFLDGADDAFVVSREIDVGDGRQRIHDGHQVERPELVLDEFAQRLPHRQRTAETGVVVVEENDEHTRVVASRLPFLVIAVADLLRRRGAWLRIAVNFDESELLDYL